MLYFVSLSASLVECLYRKAMPPVFHMCAVCLHSLTWAVLLFWLDRDLLLEVMPMFSPLSREWTTSSRKVIWIIDGSTF